MQAVKLICAAFLLIAVTAHPSNDISKFDEPEQPEPKHELEWWEGGLFYQIYPRSFKDSDGDGIGDIRGIIESLDYLVDLGVDGVWLSPIFKVIIIYYWNNMYLPEQFMEKLAFK